MDSMLCVDVRGVMKVDELQKNIRLEELLLNYTKQVRLLDLNSMETVNWRPLRFAYSIRSLFTNKVIAHHFIKGEKDIDTPYDILSNIGELPHRGYDLVMYLGSIAVKNAIKDVEGNLNTLMLHSKFDVRGFYYTGGIIQDPIIYSQIILEDSAFDEIGKKLYNNYIVKDIEAIEEHPLINKALVKDLIVLKGGNNE